MHREAGFKVKHEFGFEHNEFWALVGNSRYLCIRNQVYVLELKREVGVEMHIWDMSMNEAMAIDEIFWEEYIEGEERKILGLANIKKV